MAEQQQQLPECEETKPPVGTGILEDEKGNGSSNRLVKILWFAGLIAIMGIVAWKSEPSAVPDVPWGIVMITAIVVGGGLGGKFLEMSGQSGGAGNGGVGGGLAALFPSRGK